ncbi:Rha family transcriptional regulator [Paraclostridium sordellii]|uniref:Rha family transcriptional regulator n=1 Tax=Paraclostridium sordellii TaxID=1505 RepID=UPI0030CFCA60
MNTNLKKSKIVLKGKKIPKINEVFENGKIRSQDYCIESTYKAEENNKSYREIQVTKKACEFIANKSNEEKGIIPTNKYMKKFDRIENELYGGGDINSKKFRGTNSKYSNKRDRQVKKRTF